jgi:hypothetical protein
MLATMLTLSGCAPPPWDGSPTDSAAVVPDSGPPEDSEADRSDSTGDSGPDTGLSDPDSGAPPDSAPATSEYPVEPPPWPDCGALSDPADLGADGWTSLDAVFWAVPGFLDPLFGLTWVRATAQLGECEGYWEEGDEDGFSGACSDPDGNAIAGEYVQSWAGESWWATARDVDYLGADGYAVHGDGTWIEAVSGDTLEWAASGRFRTTLAPDDGPTQSHGDFTREDGGVCIGNNCSGGGWILAREVPEIVDGEFCWASVTEGGMHWIGPGVLRVVGRQLVEIVWTGADTGTWSVDGSEPVAL